MTYPFELIAGWPALELVNTVNARPVATRDSLGRFEDLVAWAVAVGVITEPEAERLQSANAAVREGLLRDVRALRDLTYRVFSAVAEDRPLDPLDADDLLAGLARSLPFATLRAGRSGTLELAWTDRGAIVGPLTQSAIDLLRDGPLDRVKGCPACCWLFLDRSRNGTRRWCSMDTCGSRDKMRRSRARRRVPEAGTGS
jgi:predicted RNA-binding Zn ribbon-like protein